MPPGWSEHGTELSRFLTRRRRIRNEAFAHAIPGAHDHDPLLLTPVSSSSMSCQEPTAARGQRPVFFAELDDDYQEVQGLKETGLIRRARCYFLLGPTLLIHPAFAWQSPASHNLVLGPMSELLRPPFAQIVAMGGSGQTAGSVADYIVERRRLLHRAARRDREIPSELRSYATYGPHLMTEAALLDRDFSIQDQFLSGTREKRFRAYLVGDLRAPLDPDSLVNQLHRFAQRRELLLDIDEEANLLTERVISEDVVSVDTFESWIRRRGIGGLTHSLAFKRRLLDIYYHANVGGLSAVPGAVDLSYQRVAEPYDSDLFWQAMSVMFGPEVSRLLATDTSADMVAILRRLRDDPLWREFVGHYFVVVNGIDTALRDNVVVIVERVRRLAGETDMRLLRRIWRTRKLSVVTVVLGCVAVGAPFSLIPTVAGVASAAAGGIDLAAAIRRFNSDFRSHDLVTLRQRMAEDVVRVATGHDPEGRAQR